MREILFRGKRTDCEAWVEGDLIQAFRGNQLSSCSIMPNTPTAYCWKVDPETVGQYTSLTDKNGVKIFEGDIVTGYFNHEKIVGYIFYGGNARFFIQRDGIYGIGLDNSDCWLEVIGNIHDNLGLLEGGEGE